ncbi:MAG: ChbG/HpnK family deacetylase [Bacteroidales bacterium]
MLPKAASGTSVELMTVCPWFPEAADMLKEHPGLDVGIHVALNSEWSGYKWKPLTSCPSLCDEDGYLKPGRHEAIDPEELEAEMRAQIELGLKYVKNVTHISDHMMWTLQPGAKELAIRVAEEYGLRYQGHPDVDGEIGLTPVDYNAVRKDENGKRESSFLAMLATLEKGKTYWTIEHPGLDTEEMRGITNTGWDGTLYVAGPDRQDVTDTYTSKAVREFIRSQGIELVSFGDLIREAEAGNK